MKVKRKDLSDLLNALAPAVGTKENDLQQTCYVFSEDCAYAYNDEICISTNNPFKEMNDFAVQAKEFQILLNKLKVEELDVELTADSFQIKTKRSKAEIKIETEIKMPIDEIQFPEGSSPLPDGFSRALELILPCVSRDMTKPLSTAIHLSGKYAEASDTDKCARYDFGKAVFKEPVYIKGVAAALAAKVQPTTFSVTTGWIHFTFGEKYILSCRTYYKGQEFADITSLLETKGEVLTLPEELPDSLERAGVFTDSTDGTETTHEDKYVELRIADNWLYVSGEGSIGRYEEKLRIEYTGKEIRFETTAGVLLAAVRENQTCEVCGNFVKIFDKKFNHLVAVKVVKETPKKKKNDDDDVPF